VSITPLTPPLVPAVVQLHTKALNGDFLPSLGPAFLTVLYRSIIELNLGFCFVSLDNAEEVSGFVVGTYDSRQLFRTLVTRRLFRFTAEVAAALIRKPRLLSSVFETFLYPSKEGANVPAAELLVIAVRAPDRNKGVGAALVRRLDETMRRHGIDSYKVTVLASNEVAIEFYRRLGFVIKGQFQMYRKPWNILVSELA
jgi:ribosomal protein S18 acetylase RimI-like enzyme